MILVDTSVWIDHFRIGDRALSNLLMEQQVLGHAFVVGELALGSIGQRDAILGNLRDLPQALVAGDEEVQLLIERRALFGLGIGYIDAHLLTATLLTIGARLWTRDKRLREVAIRLGVGAPVDKI